MESIHAAERIKHIPFSALQSLPLFLWCKSFVRVKDLNYHLVLIFDKYCKIKKNVVNIKSDMIMKI